MALTLLAILVQLWTKSLKRRDGPMSAFYVLIAKIGAHIPWNISPKASAKTDTKAATSAPSEVNVENPEEQSEQPSGDKATASYRDDWITLAAVIRLLFAISYFLVYFILVLALLT